jgi:GcrA cell cycle regulator
MQVGIPAEDIPVEQRKQLQELKSHHCRWPYGDPGKADFFFCGGPKIPCLSYCAAHARIAFRRAA